VPANRNLIVFYIRTTPYSSSSFVTYLCLMSFHCRCSRQPECREIEQVNHTPLLMPSHILSADTSITLQDPSAVT